MAESLQTGGGQASGVCRERQGWTQNVVIMRHGDRIDAAEPLWLSHADRPWDPPLTDTGKIRAWTTGKRLRNVGFPVHRIIVSPFLRCLQTAAEVITALCCVVDDETHLLSMETSAGAVIDPTSVKLIIEGSNRVHRCLAFPTDDALEKNARTNEIYRCCVHSWSDKVDCKLWETYWDLMRYPSYMDGAGLNEEGLKYVEGWKYVQREVSCCAAHLVPIDTLKARSAEIRRRDVGSFEEIVANPTTDVANYILYRKWDSKTDAFMIKTYDNMSFLPGREMKNFLDVADWQCVQLWFTQKFGCCPTQTQLQPRTRIVLQKR